MQAHDIRAKSNLVAVDIPKPIDPTAIDYHPGLQVGFVLELLHISTGLA